ncbi:MAG: amidohydrolase family protein [Armatimonadetes bacterium]|nr:amidohydrolase family protein [Armatimonadota bacterium]
MIDFHLHFGRMYRSSYPAKPPLSVHALVDWMNRNGVDIGVLLPLESPEGGWGYLLTEDVVEARNAYPERFVAFVCADPRYPLAAQQIDYFVKHHGCRGFGEHVCEGAFDGERNLVLYRRCEEHGLPVVFEINTDYCSDEVGLPRLARCLREFPNVAWCGHGPGFWCAISADDDRTCGYPTGPIVPGGAIDRLMEKYDNLWLDLSAGSGNVALTRDPEFTLGFVERWWSRMLFGTDYLGPGQPIPQFDWLRDLAVSDEVRDAIAFGNARRLLGL